MSKNLDFELLDFVLNFDFELWDLKFLPTAKIF